VLTRRIRLSYYGDMHRDALILALQRRYPNQSELARLLGVHRSLIGHLYAGRREPTPAFLRLVRDRLPGMKRYADLALRELILLPGGGSPADSRDDEKRLAV